MNDDLFYYHIHSMWQRTQVLVELEHSPERRELFGFHNQRWFGRPTVTSVLSVIKYAKECQYPKLNIDKTSIVSVMRVPLWLEEYIKRSDFDGRMNGEPIPDTIEESTKICDNNDGYAHIKIKLIRNQESISCQFYSHDLVPLTADEYLESFMPHIKEYMYPEWQAWYDKNKSLFAYFTDDASRKSLWSDERWQDDE